MAQTGIDSKASQEPPKGPAATEAPIEEQAPAGPIQGIVDSVRGVVAAGIAPGKTTTRDVHVKQHGLLSARFKVDSALPAQLARGVFVPGADYAAWVRFSSSNFEAQSDAIPDGRGVAIKLLDVPAGQRLIEADWAQKSTQDFILLNGPAFFARNATDMAVAAALQAKDEFPSSFFASVHRLPGLHALLTMTRSQADSPLDLTYFSQTPYKLGDVVVVKYRLRPEIAPSPGSAANQSGQDYLFEALRNRIQLSKDDFVFRFEVQLGHADDDLDDATRVWDPETHPFQPIARLVISSQTFATALRMELAENISYNPYNGLEDHEPLGSINLARRYAYQASASVRHRANGVGALDYSVANWTNLKDGDPSGEWKPPVLPAIGKLGLALQTFAHLFPGFGARVGDFLSSAAGYAVAPVVLAGFLLYGHCVPGGLAHPFQIALARFLPSEKMIPPALAGSRTAGPSDPVWLFRYGAIGTEAKGGLPYWVFRALPRMFPDRFGEKGDWSKFGFDLPDDGTYYSDYHGLPRGFVLTDTVYAVAGNNVQLDLKRVALNCATCHRGEYLDTDGNPHFVDGMPNQRLDTSAFQQAVFGSILDPKFDGDSVVSAINGVLAEEHRNRPFYEDRSETPSELDEVEVEVFKGIVSEMKKETAAQPIDWVAARPADGPGRLDAFGALRYEFLPPVTPGPHQGGPIATVDLPSIWHQGPTWRPAHHWDGNTTDTLARSYGAVVGVGGTALSIRRYDVKAINDWLETSLQPKAYPFENHGDIAKGADLYKSACASCHGTYVNGALVQPAPACMMGDPVAMKANQVGTDPFRAAAMDAKFVAALNDFGVAGGLWNSNAFRSTGSYLCPPLDGIWARAPYLHNGSVPTLEALLGPGPRPSTFWRGSAAYLPTEGGFAYQPTPSGQSSLFAYDTSKDGNGNQGHSSKAGEGSIRAFDDPEELSALVAYLYTL